MEEEKKDEWELLIKTIENINVGVVHDINDSYFNVLNLSSYPTLRNEAVLESDDAPSNMPLICYSIDDKDDFDAATVNLLFYEYIKPGHKILMNGLYIYQKKNTHNINTYYIYPAGFETENKYGCYPYATAPVQISLMQDNTGQNAIYNGRYQIKIQILYDKFGRKFNTNFIVTGYVADNKHDALVNSIYIMQTIYNNLRQQPMYMDAAIYPQEAIIDILDKSCNKFVNKIKLYERNKYFTGAPTIISDKVDEIRSEEEESIELLDF